MRRMFPVAAIAAVLGIAIGFAIAFIWLRAPHTSDSGAQILARVAKNFVAQRRTPGFGVTFFDQPKPYGDWLCRTNVYRVHEKVLTGKIERDQDRWDDDLSITMEFGVWRKPSLGRAPDGERDKACVSFRDFDNLFTTQGSADAERGVYVLDRIIGLLASGQLNIPISCSGPDSRGQPSKCDARKVLETVTLQKLRTVEALSEQEIDRGKRHTDQLWLEPDKGIHGEVLGLKVVSDQHYGKQSASEGDLRSVDVSIECIC